jgi:hypothetical protein
MYWQDHLPPHFHAEYGECEAQMDIETLEVLNGNLPRRAKALVLEWAAEHRTELRENWQKCREHEPLLPINPLE